MSYFLITLTCDAPVRSCERIDPVEGKRG